MKKAIIIGLIYLSGCVTSYNLFKYKIVHSTESHSWTTGDRAAAIALSGLSWISAVAYTIPLIIDSFDTNQPANW